jgi:hypothetical protein
MVDIQMRPGLDGVDAGRAADAPEFYLFSPHGECVSRRQQAVPCCGHVNCSQTLHEGNRALPPGGLYAIRQRHAA